jgi:hypothetical protein
MAKLRRADLKQIVKECLVEILAEGLANSRSTSTLHETRTLTSSPPRERKTQVEDRIENPDFNQAVSRSVSSLTSDPMMAALFEDTARGTYQDQMTNDSDPGKTSMAETAAPGADLSEVFGADAAQNWASLAFDSAAKRP